MSTTDRFLGEDLTMKGALTTLRGASPFVVAEALLPGSVLLTLLLWLSQAFIRRGFGDVYQFRIASTAKTILSRSMTPPSTARFKPCTSRCAVVTVWRNRFQQWCEAFGRVRQCCG